ncbi:MAG: alpha/beta hydrolase [Gammaproteobacteria bacterium]|nr:alpha/beta hydrolase [Gammaproteobacteria bacterium]
MSLSAVLLPGIDGTATMFGPLQQALGTLLSSVSIAYPTQVFLSYADLLNYVIERLPPGPIVVIAESFSGPLALMLAERLAERCRALVLVASFLSNPRRWESRLLLPWLQPWMLRLRPSKRLARFFVTGDASDAVVEFVLNNHKQVAGEVALGRLQAVFKVDVRGLFIHCQQPILHLYAKRDRVVLMRSVREIQTLRPDIPSVCIDGPHFLLQTRAQPCARVIVDFLRQQHLVPE